MSRPAKTLEPKQVVVVVPKNRREGVSVTVAGTDADWRVELQDTSIFPDAKRVAKAHAFHLKPGMLRGIAAALVAVADATDSPATDLSPEELAADLRRAPEHLKAICAVVGTGRATFLKAMPDNMAFRVFVPGASILLVDDSAAQGPGSFEITCVVIALRRAGLVVLAVNERIADQYHSAAGRALDGGHSVIIETKTDQAMAWMALLAVEVPNTPVLAPHEEVATEHGGFVH